MNFFLNKGIKYKEKSKKCQKNEKNVKKLKFFVDI